MTEVAEMVTGRDCPKRLIVPIKKTIICAPFIQKVFEISHHLHTIHSAADLIESLSHNDFISSFLILSSAASVGYAIPELHEYYSEWNKRNKLIKSTFGETFDPKFRNVEYDSGKDHEMYRNKIHPANRETILGIIKSGLPYHQKVLDGCKSYVERKIKELKKEISESKDESEGYLKFIKKRLNIFEKLIFERVITIEVEKKEPEPVDKNNNIVCIGSPKSTYYSRKLMGYSETLEPPSEPFRFVYDFDPEDFEDQYIIQVLDREIHPTKRYVIKDHKGNLYGGKNDDAIELSQYKEFFKRNFGEDYEEKIRKKIKAQYGEDTTPDQWYVLKRDYLMVTRMPNILADEKLSERENLEALIIGGKDGPGTMAFREVLRRPEYLEDIKRKVVHKGGRYYQIIIGVEVEYVDQERGFSTPFTIPREIEGIVDWTSYDVTDFYR